MCYTIISFASLCKTCTEQLTNATAKKGKDNKLSDDKINSLSHFIAGIALDL